MLTLLNNTIIITESHYRKRLAVLVYAFAIYITWCAPYWLEYKLLASAVLLFFLAKIVFHAEVSSGIRQIAWRTNKILVTGENNQVATYERLQINFEAGIFFLLELANDHEKKTQVIFFDQLKKEDYRALRLLSKAVVECNHHLIQ